MQGSVELPAEANPLTENILFHVLRSAASSDSHQIQTGTKQLQQWEKKGGFFPLLQTVFIDRSLPFEVRYLAIIQLKNGIDKYWRKTATNAVSKEDKTVIRSRLLESAANEADQRLALQNALVISKIVRFEFPNDWPDVVNELLNLLRNSVAPGASPLYLHRILLVLLHVIKELATGRTIRMRSNLQSIAPEIFRTLGHIYVDKVQQWQSFLQQGGDDEGGALENIEQSLIAIKILRRILVAGFDFPNREKDVQEFWVVVRDQLGQFLALVTQESNPLTQPVRDLVEKHLMQLSKLHLETAKAHPAAFVLLPDSMDMTKAYWGLVLQFGEAFGAKTPSGDAQIGTEGDADDEEKSILERLSLKGLLLIRACLKMVFNPTQTFKYRHDQEKQEQAQAKEIVKQQLLGEDFVKEMMETVVTRYFVFRRSDLRQWEEEPDEWERREDMEGDDFEFSVRSCAEKLFLDLAINFKDLLVQPLLGVFYSVASPDNENILFKDSVYTAVGLAAPVLHHQLDFDSFIRSTLVQEVQKQKPGYSVLRRRIAILLGQWITIKVSEESKPLVYQIFQHLLNKNDPLNDHVVRVTAGRQLKNIADDWEFSIEAFLPHAPDTLGHLMALIGEVELTETKMALLNTISVIVERLEHHITPYANSIVSLLPPLWDQSGEQHLMKQAILTIFARLINAMKAESIPYHSMVIPIIRNTLEPGSDTQVYLLEDALDLWHAVLVQTPASASRDVLSLAQYLIPSLELGTDSLRKTLEIAETYLLLAPAEMCSDDMRTSLLKSLSSLLGSLRPEANGLVTHIVETFVRTAQLLGGEAAVEVLTSDILRSGLLSKLVDGLKGAWEAHQTTGPNARASAVDGIVETDYFSVLARLALASPRILLGALSSIRPEEPLPQRMGWLLTEWFDHFDNVASPTNKKLMCLALTSLLDTHADWILIRLQDLMTLWTDLYVELTEGNEDKSVDCLVWEQEPPQLTSPEAPDDARRRDLVYSDPVHRVNLVVCVRETLQRVVQGCGGGDRFRDEWLVNVDNDVVAAFGRLGLM
ncbi:armadillo-type protein [Phyllosticta citriasiana]|uniref:Armadillo-type protein n=1 Tax=Phyllosticta citriasiana TaxID=595635 RepID=A0ABR1KLE6_9PEZI